MALPASMQTALDWGSLAPLRIRSRAVAEGIYSGAHRSVRRGTGVEFGGYREYTPGDDLRWLDRRSLLLHDRLVVRQFETETDRALRLLVDASGSMSYRGSRGRGAKLAYAAVVSAALIRIALAGGDPVGLSFLFGGANARAVPEGGGREQFERAVGALEAVQPGADPAMKAALDRALDSFLRGVRRGSVLVVLSDLFDLPDGAMDRIAALATRGRLLVVVQTLDPDEIDFPFEGTLRLRGMEDEFVVETDPLASRDAYLARLAQLQEEWTAKLVARDARFFVANTGDDPVTLVRQVIESLR